MHKPFDLYYEDYDRWFEMVGKDIFKLEVKAIKQISHKFRKPIVEVGIGTGRFGEALNVDFGFDPSYPAIRLAKRRGLDVFVGKAEKIPIKTSSINTAFLIVTICFVDDVKKAFSEINRIINIGGRLITGFVPINSNWGEFYEKKKKEGHKFYKYARFFSYEEVLNIYKKYGFYIEDVISTLLSPPLTSLSMEIRKGYNPSAGFIIIGGKKERDVWELS
jgi:SAM-dependent methyltransferase